VAASLMEALRMAYAPAVAFAQGRPQRAAVAVVAALLFWRYMRSRRRQQFEDHRDTADWLRDPSPVPSPSPTPLPQATRDPPVVLSHASAHGLRASAAAPVAGSSAASAVPGSSLVARSVSTPALSHGAIATATATAAAAAVGAAASSAASTSSGGTGECPPSGFSDAALKSAATGLELPVGGLRPGESKAEEIRRRLKFLSQTKFISCLSERAFFEIFPHLSKVKLNAGELLFDVGSPCNTGLFVVSKGSLGIFAPNGHTPMSVYSAGESVGEFSLIGSFHSTRTYGRSRHPPHQAALRYLCSPLTVPRCVLWRVCACVVQAPATACLAVH
jgi:hypothetical protein